MNGASRAVATLAGAAVAGVLLWVAAAHVDRQYTGGYWAAYGIVAAAGLVLALTQVRGRNGNPPVMFVLAFLPVLIVAGWVLAAMQPDGNWFRAHTLAWSGDIGVRDVVQSVGTWLGVLAFGVGYTLGLTLEPAPAVVVEPVPQRTVTDERVTDDRVADEPLTAERREVREEEPVRGRPVEEARRVP
jgi:hypothetical protein